METAQAGGYEQQVVGCRRAWLMHRTGTLFDRINKIYRILLVGRKAAKEFNPA